MSVGRREVLAVPMLAWLAGETAKACSISNPAFGMVESAKVFLDNLFAGNHSAVLNLIDDGFRFSRISDFEQNISGKTGFANYLDLSQPIDRKLSTHEVILEGYNKLVQHEFWKFEDLPEYYAPGCGYAYNFKSIVAIYEFYPFTASSQIVIPPPPASRPKVRTLKQKKNIPANNFSKIKSLIHVELS